MTQYAVGDLQGCYDELRRLLDQVRFDPACDQLWVVGDLVNRGPKSLQTLRFVRGLDQAARVVLGNHDLHLLAVARGAQKCKRKDSFQDILQAPDGNELTHWLAQQPLLIEDPALGLVMTHAGLPHIWTLAQAAGYAREVEAVLQGPQANAFLTAMYGNEPACWSDSLSGLTRLRVITNYLTRMRFVGADGTLDFGNKFEPENAPPGFKAWFEYPRTESTRILFGHWAALMGKLQHERYIGLDTGCVWGNHLTLLDLGSLCDRSRRFWTQACIGPAAQDD